MPVKEIQSKSILRKHKKIDSWFVARYGMNLYRGCAHNCCYCDGRAEKYQAPGDFGRDVEVKVNAGKILERELDPARKRVPFKPGYLLMGGGVGDSYQPAEANYRLARKALELALRFDFPVQVLTKSTLVEQDMDILKQINEKNRAIVSFSLSSVDDRISKIFESGVPAPTERLKSLTRFKKAGIACGVFLLPVIPFITDGPEAIEKAVYQAATAGADFIIFGGMTLKQGRQKDYFFASLKRNYPGLVSDYKYIYPGGKWGEARKEYYNSIHKNFFRSAKTSGIPVRIPPELYRDILDINDLVIVILEQIDYILKAEGRKSPYGYAAYSISRLQEPLTEYPGDLQKLSGIGPVTERIIREIIATRRSSYHEKLLRPAVP